MRLRTVQVSRQKVEIISVSLSVPSSFYIFASIISVPGFVKSQRVSTGMAQINASVKGGAIIKHWAFVIAKTNFMLN